MKQISNAVRQLSLTSPGSWKANRTKSANVPGK